MTRHAQPHDQDPAVQGLQVYVVGGAVRDGLLGLTPGDRDWVVVGATPQDMARRGFIPVGGDFPVFLHPVTKEEFALARTERKTAQGYQGFSFHTGPDVTLEDDLTRRDLTVNAIACDGQGRLIDPMDGAADVRARVLRHVAAAFCEDPVRILRLARFAARFPDFTVADETLAVCRSMVQSGEVDALVAERVWKEMARGLMALRPSRMLDVLRVCGALPRVAPELHDDAGLAARVDQAAAADLPLAARYAALCLHSPQREALGRRWRVPAVCADYARLLPEVLGGAHAAHAADRLALIEKADGLRKPERFLELIQAAATVAPAAVDVPGWQRTLDTVRGVDAGAIAQGLAHDPKGIKAAVHAARLAALSSEPT